MPGDEILMIKEEKSTYKSNTLNASRHQTTHCDKKIKIKIMLRGGIRRRVWNVKDVKGVRGRRWRTAGDIHEQP